MSVCVCACVVGLCGRASGRGCVVLVSACVCMCVCEDADVINLDAYTSNLERFVDMVSDRAIIRGNDRASDRASVHAGDRATKIIRANCKRAIERGIERATETRVSNRANNGWERVQMCQHCCDVCF